MAQREALRRDGLPLGNLEGRMVPALLSISKSTRALVGMKLAEQGFHNGQDELLFALNDKAPATVSHLAEHIGVRPSTVSKMLDRMVKAGMVERKTDKGDARRTIVQITATGREARIRLQAMRNELEADLVPALSEMSDEVTEALTILSGILKGRLSRLR